MEGFPRTPDGWYGNPVELRLRQSKLFLQLHRDACGPPTVDFFRAIAMADAALWALASLKEASIATPRLRNALLDSDLFALVQCIRNATTHREVWSSRTSYVHGDGPDGCEVRFFPLPFKLDELLQAQIQEGKARHAAESARRFLHPYVRNEKDPIYLDELIEEVVSLVEIILREGETCS